MKHRNKKSNLWKGIAKGQSFVSLQVVGQLRKDKVYLFVYH